MSVRWRGKRGDHDGEDIKKIMTRERESTLARSMVARKNVDTR